MGSASYVVVIGSLAPPRTLNPREHKASLNNSCHGKKPILKSSINTQSTLTAMKLMEQLALEFYIREWFYVILVQTYYIILWS